MSRRDRPAADRAELLVHDMRAAATDVLGGLRLLEQEPLSEGGRAQLARARAAADMLARLAERGLDGPADVPVAPEAAVCDLDDLLTEEAGRARGAGAPLGVAVTTERDPRAPRLLRMDPLALRRILANVVGNALRHARTRVSLATRRADCGGVVVRVADDGPGFRPDTIPHLLGPARRGAGSTGQGLGLHIAASHADWIGARLTVGNAPEGGASVELWIGADAVAAPASAGADPGLPDLSGWRVLVADDSETVRALVSGMLGALGAASESAVDGVTALNWLTRARFDLAIVDAEMPLLSGAEVIRAERIRQARGLAPPTPMLALTAHGEGAARAALDEAGADGVLLKPLPDVTTFGRALAALVDVRAPRAPWRPESAPPLSAATLAELMRAAGPERHALVLDRLGEDLRAVDRALEAALEPLDLAAIRFQSHALISLAGTVGALPTRTTAERLNAVARDGPPEAVRADARLCRARIAALLTELERAVGPSQKP